VPKLIATGPDGAAAEHPIKGEPLTIGRSQECSIRLQDPGVSRLHAIVEKSGSGLRVRDQGSQGGTWLNGERVQEAELEDGDELRIGGTTFRVSLVDELAEAARRRSRTAGARGEERDHEKPPRPSRREVLGGLRLSRRAQTIIKVVCAAISLACIFGIVWLITNRRRGPVIIRREVRVDPMAEVDTLSEDARRLAQQAREAEDRGSTAEAYRLIAQARDKIEESLRKLEELQAKYQGEGYSWVERKLTQINTQARGIREQWFRLKMQAEKSGVAPANAP